jgi:hypothetical protein
VNEMEMAVVIGLAKSIPKRLLSKRPCTPHLSNFNRTPTNDRRQIRLVSPRFSEPQSLGLHLQFHAHEAAESFSIGENPNLMSVVLQ